MANGQCLVNAVDVSVAPGQRVDSLLPFPLEPS